MEKLDLINEINKLSLPEKLNIVEDIWDSIARSNNELPMPEWQKIELEKRYHNYKMGEMALHDWNDVHKELRNKSE